MDLSAAEGIARKFIAEFEPLCHRIEVGGSTRRKKLCGIKDVEIVMIPRPELARELRDQLKKYQGKFPSLHTTFYYGGGKIDLFITTPEKWGCIFLIRTGSDEFNKGLMKFALAKHMRFREGRLWRGDRPFSTPEEAEVFRELGLPFISPERRTGPAIIAKAAAMAKAREE